MSLLTARASTMLPCVEPGLQLPVHQPRYAFSFHLLSCSQALHAQQSCQWSVVFATLLQSGKDATTSGKAAASQLSKGSRKSKAKSGVSITISSILHAANTNRLVCHIHYQRTHGIVTASCPSFIMRLTRLMMIQ